jgi:hypothetical protein
LLDLAISFSSLMFGETWLKWLQIAFCFPLISVQIGVVHSLMYNKCQSTHGWLLDNECGLQLLIAKCGLQKSGFWDRVLRCFDHIFLAGYVWSLEAVIPCWGFLSISLTAIPSSFDLILPASLRHQAHCVLFLTSDRSIILVIYLYQHIRYCAGLSYYLIKEDTYSAFFVSSPNTL